MIFAHNRTTRWKMIQLDAKEKTIDCCMTGSEETNKKRIHCTQQYSVPNVSRPVAQNNGVEAYHQAAALLGPLISWPLWKKTTSANTAQLAGPESDDDFIGWMSAQSSSVTIRSALCAGRMPECQKTPKQLAAEILQRPPTVAASCPGRKNLPTRP